MAFVATSCSSDEPGVAPEGNFTPTETQTVTFNISNPDGGIRSRGQDANGWFGDGLDAEELQYCVYERRDDGIVNILVSSNGTSAPKPVKSNKGTTNSWDLSLRIPADVKWDAYFYADYYGKSTPKDLLKHNMKIEWDKERLHFYDNFGYPEDHLDTTDAFFGVKSCESYADDIKNGEKSTVSLKRPLMQVNVLSNECDYGYSSVLPIPPSISMQFSNGAEVGIPEFYYFKEDRLTFKNGGIDYGLSESNIDYYNKISYNGKQYDLFFMGYFLAPKTSSTNSTDWPTAPNSLLFDLEVRKGPVRISKSFSVPFSSLSVNPYTQNSRVVIYADASDGDGFIADNATFHIDVSSSFENDGAINGTGVEYN